MKNVLLTVAMVATATVCNAQNVMVAQPAVKAQDIKATVLNAPVPAAKCEKAPRKTRQSGVYYERPEGLWYSEYIFGSASDMAAFAYPALAELTFVNGCPNPAAAEWTINEKSLAEYVDEDNNLPWSYAGCADLEYGYNGYYGPAISAGKETFQAAPICMVANQIFPISVDNPVVVSRYSGFEDGPAWGTGSVLVDVIYNQVPGAQVVALRRNFEKPASPLYLTSISMMGYSKNEDPLKGNVLTLSIYKLDEEGYQIEDEPTHVLTCSSIDTEENASLGYVARSIEFSETVVNEFGDEEANPIVIDYPFVIEFTGYDQEGVNLNFFLHDIGEDPYEWAVASPTYIKTVVGDKVSNYYFKGEGKTELYCYSMPFTFNALYDNVIIETTATDPTTGEVYEGANYVKVADDGESCESMMYSDIDGALVSTATPWFEEGNENYYSEELPEWISAISAEELGEDYECQYVVTFITEPLPADVTGRGAFVYLTGRGVVSEDPIFVFQGDIEAAWDDAVAAAGIEFVTTTPMTVKNGNLYNVAGQVVNNDYKGIVIKNGKKFMNK